MELSRGGRPHDLRLRRDELSGAVRSNGVAEAPRSWKSRSPVVSRLPYRDNSAYFCAPIAGRDRFRTSALREVHAKCVKLAHPRVPPLPGRDSRLPPPEWISALGVGLADRLGLWTPFMRRILQRLCGWGERAGFGSTWIQSRRFSGWRLADPEGGTLAGSSPAAVRVWHPLC